MSHGWEEVYRCWGQAPVVNFPFSVGTDRSSLTESHLTSSCEFRTSQLWGTQTRFGCLSHWCSGDCDPWSKWETWSGPTSPAASSDTPLCSLSHLPKCQCGLTFSHAEELVTPAFVWQKHSICDPLRALVLWYQNTCQVPLC